MTPLILAFFAAAPAHATTYAYTGRAWDPATDFPLSWYQSESQDDQLDPTFQEQVLIDSFDAWIEGAPCAQLSQDYGGVRDGETGGRSTSDRINTMYWDDPADDKDASTGVLGVTFCSASSEIVGSVDGVTLYHNYDCDIIFNDDISWGTPEEIASSCAGQYDIKGVATHEIGHLWGLDHSCEDPSKGGPTTCADQDKKDATMYWQGGACDDAQETPNTWDIGAMTSLYGPFATFSSEGDLFGGVPIEVCFNLEASEDALAQMTGLTWAFGDGETSTETDPCHTYTTQGQFTVNLTVEGTSDSCGQWSYTQRERAYVLACEAPHPSDGLDGLFSYTPSEGLIYQMVNQADTTVYGCIDQVQWEVYQGDALIKTVAAWSPKIEFPEEGTYRVLVNLGGPGGVTAGELEIEVTDVGTTEGGCSTVPAGVGLAGLLASLGLVASRRRS